MSNYTFVKKQLNLYIEDESSSDKVRIYKIPEDNNSFIDSMVNNMNSSSTMINITLSDILGNIIIPCKEYIVLNGKEYSDLNGKYIIASKKEIFVNSSEHFTMSASINLRKKS